MHHQPRRLVDDEQHPVFEHDLDRHGLRSDLRVRLQTSLDMDVLSPEHLVLGPKAPAVNLDSTRLEPALQPGPRVLRQRPGKRLVEAQAGQLGRQSQRVRTELGPR